MAKDKHTSSQLVELLKSADREDLNHIDEQLVELGGQLDMLKLLKKAIEAKLALVAEKPPKPDPRPSSENPVTPVTTPKRETENESRVSPQVDGTIAEKIKGYLQIQGRPCRPNVIASDLGLQASSVQTVLSQRRDWFTPTPDGWKLGRRDG